MAHFNRAVPVLQVADVARTTRAKTRPWTNLVSLRRSEKITSLGG